MLIKLGIILLVLKFTVCQYAKLDWELAVVVDNELRLLTSNGTLIYTKDQPFSSLKALAYDNVRDQFIVSDELKKNDTVYTVQIDKQITVPIIQGLPGDVQGLAVDPIDDMLYWTDEVNHTIHQISLNENYSESKAFFFLEDKNPHALAIDICQRYLYFTNSDVSKPSIDRIKLDGTDHQVIVDSFLKTPTGITIDYKAQRIYWADSRDGYNAGRIESSNLDGTDRKTVVERNAMRPFGLAVDEEAIYWTDTINTGLFKFFKGQSSDVKPEKFVTFTRMPMGLVANNNIVKEEPDCVYLEEAVKKYKEEEEKEEPELFGIPEEEEAIKECLNSGELLGNYCKCSRGFDGKRCEVPVCKNLCLNGDCYTSPIGIPKCKCDRGFVGDRCQRYKCDGYCLNGGECSIQSPREVPKCRCAEGFMGERCEYTSDVCEIYCVEKSREDIVMDKYERLCTCGESFYLNQRSNHTAAAYTSPTSDQNEFTSLARDPVVYLSALVVFCVMVIVALSIFTCSIQKRRPRIKKRIIVNKNVTPLTYRPQQPTEQCEITIENCCNMNVCETPCFEPREDKKKLLKNMEGDDLY